MRRLLVAALPVVLLFAFALPAIAGDDHDDDEAHEQEDEIDFEYGKVTGEYSEIGHELFIGSLGDRSGTFTMTEYFHAVYDTVTGA